MEIQLEKGKAQERLELIIKCTQTGEQLTSKTIYEGKPVGMWLIQYRSLINNGKNLNISNEILNQLEKLGLLEKRIGSSIEEKIQELIDWNKEYPCARVTGWSCDKQELMRYTTSKEEYQELLKKYEKMQEYYKYIRSRKSRGKLSKKHEKKCKEGNVRGVFGYPSATIELSRKYGLKLEKIDYILSKYGNMENFTIAFMNNKLDNEDMGVVGENLNTFIDISKQGDIRHIKFIKYFANHIKNTSIMEQSNHEIKFFDSTKIPQLIGRLTSKSSRIINMSFGFKDGKDHLRREVAEEFNVTMQAISIYIREGVLKLIGYEKANSIVFQGGEISQCTTQNILTLEQKEKIKSLLSRIYNSNLIFIPDEGFTQESNDITPEELYSIATQVKAIREEQIQTEEFAMLKDMGLKTLEEGKKLERLKHLKAEKEYENEELKTKKQEASELLESYEQLVNGTGKDNFEQR